MRILGFFVVLALALTGCKSSNHGRYSVLESSPAASVADEGPSAITNAFAEDIPLGKFRPVSLPRKLDPTWFQPPSDLYTLGPGDHLDIELIGDPASRA